MEVEKTVLVDKLARLAKINKELVEKNDQLDKEHKDEVAHLTSKNTKLKERVSKLDKNFSSKLSTTQLLIPFSIIHHAQMVLCLSVVVRQNAKTHLEELIKERDHLASKCKEMEEGIKPMLDLISMEPEEGPIDRPAQPEAIIKKCQSS
jgi:myosin heavy subunit